MDAVPLGTPVFVSPEPAFPHTRWFPPSAWRVPVVQPLREEKEMIGILIDVLVAAMAYIILIL